MATLRTQRFINRVDVYTKGVNIGSYDTSERSMEELDEHIARLQDARAFLSLDDSERASALRWDYTKSFGRGRLDKTVMEVSE